MATYLTSAYKLCSGGSEWSSITTSSIDTTGATLLVVTIHHYAPNAPSLSDSKSNTWSLAHNQGSGNERTRIYYCFNPTVGSGHTFSNTGALNYASMSVIAFSGNFTASVNANNGAYGASPQATGSITPSQNGAVLISGCTQAGGTSYVIDNSFTSVFSAGYVYDQNMGGASSYKIQSTAAAINPSWSWSGGGSCAVAIAAFVEPASGGPFPHHLDSGSMSGGFQSLGFNRLAHKWPHWKTTRRASGLLLAQAG